MNNQQISRERILALDGLKGFSLMIIIAYYFVQHLVPGGFVFANVFFLIGGFLNFRYFKKRMLTNQPLNYRKYYLRRFERLFFPQLWMMIVVTVFILFVSPKNYFNLRNMGATSLVFVNNLYQSFSGFNYFAQAANQSVFAHLWFISMYAQFIILTPVLVEISYKWHKQSTLAMNILGIISIISMVLMTYLQMTGNQTTSLYFNPLARLFAYTIGGILSLALPYQLKPKTIDKRRIMALNITGIMVLFIMWMMVRYMYGTQPFALRYGMALFTILSAVLLVIAIYPQTIFYKILTFKWLAVFGQKSYAYYLWFYPIILIMPEILKTINRSFSVYIIVSIIIIALCAEFSYALMERRIVTLPIGQHVNWQKSKAQLLILRDNIGQYRLEKVATLTYSVLLLIGFSGMLLAPQLGSGTRKEMNELLVKNSKIVQETLDPTVANKIVINNIDGLAQDVKLYANAIDITFFGDSIFLMSAEKLRDVFPKAVIDAAQGRQLYSSVSNIEQLKEQQMIAPIVVTMLGTNGSFTRGQLDDYIEAIGEDSTIYFVLISTTRAWTQTVNNELYRAAKRYGNVKLIDWGTYANTHNDWFYDEFHPNEQGSLELAKLIATELYRQK